MSPEACLVHMAHKGEPLVREAESMPLGLSGCPWQKSSLSWSLPKEHPPPPAPGHVTECSQWLGWSWEWELGAASTPWDMSLDLLCEESGTQPNSSALLLPYLQNGLINPRVRNMSQVMCACEHSPAGRALNMGMSLEAQRCCKLVGSKSSPSYMS